MQLNALIKRNSKLFFKDKGMFFTSLITPIILLVLYVTFLAKIYKDAFSGFIPQAIEMDEKLINGAVSGQLLSSLLAVSCVTVAFCANLLMVNDKVNYANKDFAMTPVKSSLLALSYFISSAGVTLIICLTAFMVGLIYLSVMGWYLSVFDIVLLIGDIILLVLFGTALSSLINCRLTTAGHASAVGTIVSSGYGFICGAYMPISSFPEVLQKIISFLPGTYGTALLRNHYLRGVYAEMLKKGYGEDIVENIKKGIDCNIYFFDKKVSIPYMYLILIGSVIVITLCYIALCRTRNKK